MQKRLLPLLLALVMCLGLSPGAAFAADSDFTIENGVLREYNGPGGAVVIPDGVTEIYNAAFVHCTSLTSVTIPNSVTEIGSAAFAYCSNLTNVTISDSVTEIIEGTFYGCTSLTSVTIPDGVTVIGGQAFEGCTSLTSVTIPSSVTVISGDAFKNTPWQRSLGDFVVVNGILVAYQGSGRDVVIPDGVTEISDSAFRNCESATSVTIPNSVTAIESRAFYCCTSLASVTIPNSVATIGSSAFAYCSNLTAVTIPNSATDIGASYLGGNVFGGCTSLTAINVSPGNPRFTSVDGVMFDKDVTRVIAYPAGRLASSYTIPASVTDIGEGAFEYCNNLTGMDIPDGVTTIGRFAFDFCESLTSVTIPNSVTAVKDLAFSNCPGLTSMVIPDSVTELGGAYGVFECCDNLSSVTIGSGVTSLRQSEFLGCTSLARVYLPSSVTQIFRDVFLNCTALTDVYYGGTEDQWKSITIYGGITASLASADIHYNSAGMTAQPSTPAQSSKYETASPTDDKLMVNGELQNPTVYKINGNNYFKIRDLAAMLNGTEKQFDVGYDDALKSVTATTGKGYARQPGDLAGAAVGGSQTVSPSGDTIYIDGQKINAAVYKIGGNNYFKLRDLGEALNFYVGWTQAKGVFIDTSRPYSG